MHYLTVPYAQGLESYIFHARLLLLPIKYSDSLRIRRSSYICQHRPLLLFAPWSLSVPAHSCCFFFARQYPPARRASFALTSARPSCASIYTLPYFPTPSPPPRLSAHFACPASAPFPLHTCTLPPTCTAPLLRWPAPAPLVLHASVLSARRPASAIARPPPTRSVCASRRFHPPHPRRPAYALNLRSPLGDARPPLCFIGYARRRRLRARITLSAARPPAAGLVRQPSLSPDYHMSHLLDMLVARSIHATAFFRYFFAILVHPFPSVFFLFAFCLHPILPDLTLHTGCIYTPL